MSRILKSKEERWRLEEHIAFECALAQDEREDWQVLRERDRGLAISESLWAGRDYRGIARLWLAERMRGEEELKRAADRIAHSLALAGQLLGLGAFLLGIGLSTAALVYTGDAPINVSAFFCVFVLMQAVFACLLFVPFLLPQSFREGLVGRPVFRFASFVFGFVFGKTQALAIRFLEGQKRGQAAEIVGAVRSRLVLHQGVIKWLSFSKLQGAALCFNVGAILALLVAVVFSDRAFGWQTTLSVDVDTVHRLVAFFASPWAWFYGEGLGYPDLGQIEGSRIVLKEGIRSLSTPALSAWWRFLAMGMLAYGVLPRLVFWVLGRLQLRGALRRYDFGNASAQRLFERLRPAAPRFDVEAVDQASVRSLADAEGSLTLESSQRVCCIFPDELADVFDRETLRAALGRRWSLPLANVEMRSGDGVFESDSNLQYAFVFESWMPPIKEVERQIKELRLQIDARALIKVVLLGIPDPGKMAISLRPVDQYRDVWDSFIRRQGDPYLILDNPS